ncbi:hypothetical protein GII33_12840 [Gordonia pseudamarae]|uniref:hypothetical protein n=1 Tax=Gordonia pseudamarae TaxID=2831662 RepID=UPI001AF19EBE|nr:hypothetical protein [Gordonia pseudamarae]QHN26707.1 hypothetical protein GII33_12840 [Gordonia pseudamarae]
MTVPARTGRRAHRTTASPASAASWVGACLLMGASALLGGCDNDRADESNLSRGDIPVKVSGPLVDVVRCEQTGPHTVELVVDMINPYPTPAQFSGHVRVADGAGRPFADSGLGHIGPIGAGYRQRHTETLVREHNDATDPRCTPVIGDPEDWTQKLKRYSGYRGTVLAPTNIRLTGCDGDHAVEFRNPHGPAWNVWAWVERFDADGASLGSTITAIWPGPGQEPLWGRETRPAGLDPPRVDRPAAGCRVVGAWYVVHDDVSVPVP